LLVDSILTSTPTTSDDCADPFRFGSVAGRASGVNARTKQASVQE
jgi:hypothetical protein